MYAAIAITTIHTMKSGIQITPNTSMSDTCNSAVYISLKYHNIIMISHYGGLLRSWCEFILFHFREILSRYREILSRFRAIISGFRDILSRFHDILSCFCKILLSSRNIILLL